VHAVFVEQDDRAPHAVAVLFDQLHEAREDDIECGAGSDHPEHFLLPRAEVRLLPASRDVP